MCRRAPFRFVFAICVGVRRLVRTSYQNRRCFDEQVLGEAEPYYLEAGYDRQVCVFGTFDCAC